MCMMRRRQTREYFAYAARHFINSNKRLLTLSLCVSVSVCVIIKRTHTEEEGACHSWLTRVDLIFAAARVTGTEQV